MLQEIQGLARVAGENAMVFVFGERGGRTLCSFVQTVLGVMLKRKPLSSGHVVLLWSDECGR